MFLAGVVPAFVIFVSLTIYVFFYVRKREGLVAEKRTPRQIVRAILVALPILVAPVVLLGGILGGIFTPTEASGVTVVYLIVVSFIAGWMDVKSFSVPSASRPRPPVR